MASRKRIETIFLNIPYDQEFETLYLAYIVGLSERFVRTLPIAGDEFD